MNQLPFTKLTNHRPNLRAQSFSKQLLRTALLLLTLAGFAWRVYRLDFQSLWRDEVDAVYFALRELPATLSMFISAGQNGALYFLSLRPWLSIMGSSEFALRFPSTFTGTLSIPLLWQVTRLLLSRQRFGNHRSSSDRLVDGIAFSAATLLACNPYQVWYGQEGKMYATITCLTLIATWCWLRGIVAGGWRPWLGYLVTVSVAMYTHLLMILLIPLHMVWFAIAWPLSRYHWRGYGLALAGLTLPYLPFVWWQWDLLTAKEKTTLFEFVPLGEMLKTLALNHSFGFAPHSELIWLSPLIFLIIAGLLLGWEEMPDAMVANPGSQNENNLPEHYSLQLEQRHKTQVNLSNWRAYLLIITWIAVPILEIYTLSTIQPVYTDRYIIWIAPAVAILLALGAGAVRSVLGWAGSAISTVLLLFVLGSWLYGGWHQKTTVIKFDLRAAVHQVMNQRSPDSLLILQIPHTEWAYRYYSSDQGADPFTNSDLRLGRWVGGSFTNRNTTDEEAKRILDSEMRSFTENYKDVWVILSEVTMWDQRRLTEAWLDSHATLEETTDYYGVQVRHYRFIQ